MPIQETREWRKELEMTANVRASVSRNCCGEENGVMDQESVRPPWEV